MQSVLDILSKTTLVLYTIIFIISLIRFPLYRHTPLKFLPIIFGLTLLTEILGYYIREVYGPPNAIIFNIYYLFYFSLLFYIFKNVIVEEKFKKYIKIGIWIFWLFYLSDWIFTDFINGAFVRSYIAGAGILVFCILLYYISVLQSNLVLVIKNDMLFWISVGLFLFYIGYLPIKIIRTWFYQPGSFIEVLFVIQFVLIIVMYLFFFAGLVWMKKRL